MTMGSCFVCDIPTTNLCSGCKSASYCNKEHQKQVGSKRANCLYLTPLSLPPVSLAGLEITQRVLPQGQEGTESGLESD
jgi:hypothetical protein